MPTFYEHTIRHELNNNRKLTCCEKTILENSQKLIFIFVLEIISLIMTQNWWRTKKHHKANIPWRAMLELARSQCQFVSPQSLNTQSGPNKNPFFCTFLYPAHLRVRCRTAALVIWTLMVDEASESSSSLSTSRGCSSMTTATLEGRPRCLI